METSKCPKCGSKGKLEEGSNYWHCGSHDRRGFFYQSDLCESRESLAEKDARIAALTEELERVNRNVDVEMALRAAIDSLPAAEPDAGERVAKHDIAPSIKGSRCSVCGAPAAHKVGEESCSVGEFKGPMFADREAMEAYIKTGQSPPCFHNLTNWLCCVCFARVMGPFAAQRCGVEDSDLAASRPSAKE